MSFMFTHAIRETVFAYDEHAEQKHIYHEYGSESEAQRVAERLNGSYGRTHCYEVFPVGAEEIRSIRQGTQVQSGDYTLPDGRTAHVQYYGQNGFGDWCWLGSVDGRGDMAWNEQGEEITGDEPEYNLFGVPEEEEE